MAVDGRWLAEHREGLTVLDCRPLVSFARAHVRGALNVPLPASVIALRRLSSGALPVASAFREQGAREAWAARNPGSPVVVYGEPKVAAALVARLQQDGAPVLALRDSFEEFQTQYPEWCESADEDPSSPLVGGLEALRISTGGEPGSEPAGGRVDSGLEVSPDDTPFPVEILPYLFLGNAANSQDLESLQRHNISYILNVTPNLPNVFENQRGFRYLQIPIRDHWSQNLAAFFPPAIAFIDEGRQRRKGVLVHCVAGVSRSVTVTLAYLMHKLHMSLNDAYDLVRRRHANISPNLNFMGQLMDLEKTLHVVPGPCVCSDAPCTCRSPATLPDSGVDLPEPWT